MHRQRAFSSFLQLERKNRSLLSPFFCLLPFLQLGLIPPPPPPNCCPSCAQDHLAIAMEYASGGDLSDYLDCRRRSIVSAPLDCGPASALVWLLLEWTPPSRQGAPIPTSTDMGPRVPRRVHLS
jgi:hypothetical protein